MSTLRIGMIGAGSVGGALGARLSTSGLPVKFGLNSDKDRSALLEKCAKDATTGTVEEAASFGDVVFLAVPGKVAVDVAQSLAKQLDGKIVVDCNNPLTWNEGPVWNPPPEGSLSAAIAKAAPGARVVKAFNTFGAEHHANPNLSGVPAQVFFAGDDADAKAKVADIASRAGFRPVDSGPLRNAAVLENLAMLWIHLALVSGHGRSIVFDLRGAKA